MSNGGIDRLPVNQLIERYNLVRSAVYSRLEALGIKPERIGNKSYVNAEQIQLLDDLHQCIQSGRTTAEFLESRGLPLKNKGLPREEDLFSESSSGLSTLQPDIASLISAITSEVVSRIQPPTNRFAYFQILENACQGGWVLTTSEVADLLKLDPSEIRYYGDSFSEAGFVFTRSGYRGGDVAWSVSKPVK